MLHSGHTGKMGEKSFTFTDIIHISSQLVNSIYESEVWGFLSSLTSRIMIQQRGNTCNQMWRIIYSFDDFLTASALNMNCELCGVSGGKLPQLFSHISVTCSPSALCETLEWRRQEKTLFMLVYSWCKASVCSHVPSVKSVQWFHFIHTITLFESQLRTRTQ